VSDDISQGCAEQDTDRFEGDNLGIGVFLWATNSNINERTPGFDGLSAELSTNALGTNLTQEM